MNITPQQWKLLYLKTVSVQQEVDSLVLRTPSGAARTALTDANMHLLDAALKMNKEASRVG